MNKEKLLEKGYTFDEDEVFAQYIKTITPMTDVVVQVSPVFEVFIWVKDNDFEDPDMDGQRIGLDTEDLDFAEKIAKVVMYVGLD